MKKCEQYSALFISLILFVGPTWGEIPPGWSNMDIGTSVGGSSLEMNGIWEVTGNGQDIWLNQDAFHYAYYPLNGDGFIEARILRPGFVGGNHEWSKAGVMIRESTVANSKHVFMTVTRNTGSDNHFLALQRRPNTGGDSYTTHGGATQSYPIWVRLTRTGNTFQGEYSLDDGDTWFDYGTTNVSMRAEVLLGLAVTSHQHGITTTVTFDNVNYTGSGENNAPQVDAGQDLLIIQPETSVTLSGTVKDDGLPLPGNPAAPNPDEPNKLRWTWSVDSIPSNSSGVVWSGSPASDEEFTYEGSPNPPGTIFTCNPTFTFDVVGQYVFRLSADDGQKSASDTVSVFVSPPDHREHGYMYLSPVPGSEYVSRETRYFLVRFNESISPYETTNLETFIEVAGHLSGSHPGQTKIASDDRTVIFEVSSGFMNNEIVTVTLAPIVTNSDVEPYMYQFMTTGPMPDSQQVTMRALPPSPLPSSSLETLEPLINTQDIYNKRFESLSAADMFVKTRLVAVSAGPGQAGIMPNGVSVPSNFPHINITINDNPDSGYIFLDNRTSGDNSYNVIFDNTGSPIWYWQTPDERRDMKVQHNGMLTMLARDGGMRFIGLDTNYKEIAPYRAVNGYRTDEHELVVLENGHYLLIGHRTESVDMTPRYFPTGTASDNASVRETVIQEFTSEGDLIFQWRAWDNFDIRDVHLDNPRDNSFRFPHMNAIDIDEDGHILLSSRHISEVTKINRDTGEMIWRLSGIPKNNDFTYINDLLNGFRNQHAVRNTGNGRYLLFDNGNLHSPSVSRAVEYELDIDTMTATVVWEFRDTPDKYSHYMANTQRLPNGNTLINWAVGHLPKLTEVRPDGTKAFEMNWVDCSEAYRVWRCQWQGNAAKPYLIIEPQPDNLTLLFNKFGDPNVAYYRIYGGTSPQPTTLLDTSEITMKSLTNLINGARYYFRVTAVDINGVESDYSNEENALVYFQDPGQNGQELVVNGDFSQGKKGWIWELQGGDAQWNVSNGVAHFSITDGGQQIYSVQLRQAGIPLIRGQSYIFKFDAWATAPRVIEAKVGQDQSPYTNYSQIGYSYVTTQRRRFEYNFTMNDSTDTNARVVINTGTSDSDIYLDNVSLKQQ